MCVCENGYWEDDVLQACVLCHPNCAICSGPTKECALCAQGTVWYLDLYCEDFCPYPYTEDTVN